MVCSIHQPRSSIFDALDDLVLLSEGRCLYAGPAAAAVSHFAALGHQCPPQYNPADFLIDLVSVDYSSAESEAETRARLETLADRALDSTEHKDGDAHDILVETAGVEAPRSGWLRQLKLLFGRSLRQR